MRHSKQVQATIGAALVALTLTALQPAGAQAKQAGANASAPAAKLNDPTIVAIFDAANTWDVETGQLAAKKGTTKEIRDFGAMLVHDHTLVRQQGRDLAKKLSVTPTP